MQTAAAYIRVSTKDQTELSPDSQIKLIKEYAKSHDMTLPNEYIFRDDGISGRKAEKRPEFMNMISSAKEKPRPFDVILVWKYSRFARNQEESIVYKSLLRRDCGVEVVSVSEPLADGPFGSLIERIIEWMDDFYSVRLAGEVRRGMAERASRGGTMSTSPFGYKNENGTLVPHPENAEALKQIFSLFLEGMPYRRIAEEMNDLGYRLRRGGRFEGRTVKYTLLNPVYVGKVRFSPTNSGNYFNVNADDEIIAQGHHEPLVDEETFERVQERIAEIESHHVPYRRESTGGDYMLKGLVRCDSCAATLVRCTTGSLQCNNYAKGSCKVSHSVVETKLNSMVISSLKTVLKSGEFDLNIKKQSASSETDPRFGDLIRAEHRKLNRVKEAYAAGIDTLDEYRANKNKITETIKQLEEKAKPEKKTILKKEKTAFAQKHLKTVEQLYDSTVSPEEKNKLMKGFIETIIYSKQNESLRFIFYLA